jgi:protoporphyrinogen oxidase
MTIDFTDVVVAGGGLGGLVTAALLARRGLGAVVLERSHSLGGRASTLEHHGFFFNQGGHALYAGGPAARVLRALGVRWTDGAPPASGLAVLGDRMCTLPVTPSALLRTSLLDWPAKARCARLFAQLRAADTRALAGTTLDAWLDTRAANPVLRATMHAIARLTTFTNAPERLSAGAAIAQMRLGQKARRRLPRQRLGEAGRGGCRGGAKRRSDSPYRTFGVVRTAHRGRERSELARTRGRR